MIFLGYHLSLVNETTSFDLKPVIPMKGLKKSVRICVYLDSQLLIYNYNITKIKRLCYISNHTIFRRNLVYVNG